MALQNVTGIITKCGSYPVKEVKPYQYEGKTITNTHRQAIQIGDDWYSMGESTKEDFIVKDSEGKWKVLGVGSNVMIQYTLSDCGKYRNSKKSQMMVLELVAGTSFKKADNGGGSGASSGTTAGSGTNPAEVGQCINLTECNLMGLHSLDDEQIMKYITMYKRAKERFTKAFNGTLVAEAPKPTPQPMVEPDEFDNDIPF